MTPYFPSSKTIKNHAEGLQESRDADCIDVRYSIASDQVSITKSLCCIAGSSRTRRRTAQPLFAIATNYHHQETTFCAPEKVLPRRSSLSNNQESQVGHRRYHQPLRRPHSRPQQPDTRNPLGRPLHPLASLLRSHLRESLTRRVRIHRRPAVRSTHLTSTLDTRLLILRQGTGTGPKTPILCIHPPPGPSQRASSTPFTASAAMAPSSRRVLSRTL
jgi:hypothetical protein